MSNRATHAMVGVGVGALAAAYQAKDQDHNDRLWEILGGCLGGYYGARLPDIFDPPNHPRHRHIAHGAINATITGTALVNVIDDIQNWLRTQADKMAEAQSTSTDGIEKALFQIAECLLRILAGAVAAIIAGYGSHLILDATTPSGLPLFMRGL